MSSTGNATDIPVMERRRWLIDILCSNVFVAILFVALRLFSRRLMRQKIWWDDYLIIFALVGYATEVAITGVLLHLGLGMHVEAVDPGLIPTSNKLHLVVQILYQWIMMAAKTSILLMYYRIFKVMPYFRAAATAVFAIVLLTALVFSFLYPLHCDPVAKLFYPWVPGRCISTKAVGITNGSINILTDVLTLCLPFPQVWKLPLKRMEKVTVSIAFALGLFVVFASSYRIYVFKNIDPRDTTYGLVPIFGWSLIDCFAAILSACLPVMKPVLFFLLDKLHLHGDKSLLERGWNKVYRRGKGGRVGGKEAAGDTTWTEQDSTMEASLARKSSQPRGPRGSVGGMGLDYTEARKHWFCASDTLRGDLRDEEEGDDGGDDDDDDIEAAIYFQTMSILKSDG